MDFTPLPPLEFEYRASRISSLLIFEFLFFMCFFFSARERGHICSNNKLALFLVAYVIQVKENERDIFCRFDV